MPGNFANNRTSWQCSLNLLNLQCRTGQKQLSHPLKCKIPMNKENKFFKFIFQGMFNVNSIYLVYFVTSIFALLTFSNFLPISSDNQSIEWSRPELSVPYSTSSPAWCFEVHVHSTACGDGPITSHAGTGINQTASMATAAQPPSYHYLLLFCLPEDWNILVRLCRPNFFLLPQSTKLSMQHLHCTKIH